MVMCAMGGRWTTYKLGLSRFLLLILVLVQGCSSLDPQGLALLEFRAGVSRDPYGAFGTWNPDDHDPCSWSNVHCVDGNVQVLDLDGLSLEGVLAPEIGSLTHLRRLVLSHNQFAGAIPKELGELTMLEVLDLRDNNLSGHIPSELGRMHSLKRLLLCNNNLEGSIPMELRTLNFLYEMQYDENLLSIVADGIAGLNRKFGRCILQGGFRLEKKADSVLTRMKDTVNNYLNPLQLFRFGKGSSHHFPISEKQPEMVHNVKQDANVVRRKLAEESPNLAAAPSPNDGFGPPKIIALPSSRSSGSFPAVPKDKKAHAINQPPSYGLVQGSPEESSSTSSQPPTNDQPPQSRMNSYKCRILIAISCIVLLLIIGIALCFVCRTRAVKTIGPWRSGISGQLQKAFVTGVPKLNRTELETACEDFSNIIEAKESYTLYKGTLSSGVEICVASTTIASLKDWSKRAELGFRKKIDALSRVNHKNFVNLIGYCEEDEPFVRMMVFEYAPNGSLSEHLHVEELEHLDWSLRMRIIMGTAYCLEYMHELNPPIPHTNLNATLIRLTDDYAPKFLERFCIKSEGISRS
ncbi:protein MALE DISCOVERER 1-like isoform X3 [Cynara cardunculus var. scolymus]|uniref:protein MALE DISCOVERER 1-like isoform X3 n=1 Tax=Cynara cardunculus var. scolymus TaxID=59895 RepID=UPI000D62D975|nr:protein MALE DISCOVERER 1-like isoform X3 [Cynara cardunculus var. scolymus]